MAKLKIKTTYYVGRPVKENQMYVQKVAYVDKNGLIHYQKSYSAKARDFQNGFMGFGVSERAINISQTEFNKISKNNSFTKMSTNSPKYKKSLKTK